MATIKDQQFWGLLDQLKNGSMGAAPTQAAFNPYAMAPVGMSASEKELQKQLEANIQNGIAQRANQVEFDKLNMGQALKNQGGFANMDLTPLFATAKMLGNKNAGEDYKASKNLTNEQLASLNKNIQTGQGAITDDQNNLLKLKLMKAKESKGNYFQQRLAQGADRMDRGEHMKIVSMLNTNKPLTERASQYQNLANAMTLVDKPKALTTQQIHEFQQAIRKNLGISGSSGVGEREETYLKSLGLNVEAYKQFLTGEPAEISKNSAFVAHLKDLARNEQESVQSQYRDTLDAVSEGRASLYDRRPDLKHDLDRKILSMGKRVGIGSAPAGAASSLIGGGQDKQPLSPEAFVDLYFSKKPEVKK